MDFTFTDWMWLKLIGGGILVFLANFLYTFFTGKSIGEALNERRDRAARQRHR